MYSRPILVIALTLGEACKRTCNVWRLGLNVGTSKYKIGSAERLKTASNENGLNSYILENYSEYFSRALSPNCIPMKILALEAWALANNEYQVAEPPYWHAKVVPDAFTALSGLLWSVSYILMTVKSFRDKSYSMPIYCLCLNITWEAVYGFVYGPGLVNQIVFAQWMIVDLFLFYATVKFGKQEWQHQPLVARNLLWIILAGCTICLWLHLAVAATFVPHVGRRIVFFTAWPIQVIINIGSIAQILCRGHSAGHSWNIWYGKVVI